MYSVYRINVYVEIFYGKTIAENTSKFVGDECLWIQWCEIFTITNFLGSTWQQQQQCRQPTTALRFHNFRCALCGSCDGGCCTLFGFLNFKQENDKLITSAALSHTLFCETLCFPVLYPKKTIMLCDIGAVANASHFLFGSEFLPFLMIFSAHFFPFFFVCVSVSNKTIFFYYICLPLKW